MLFAIDIDGAVVSFLYLIVVDSVLFGVELANLFVLKLELVFTFRFDFISKPVRVSDSAFEEEEDSLFFLLVGGVIF